MDVSQGIAVVTGAAMGIGRAIAEAILRKGGKVVIADFEEQTGQNTTEELKAKYGQNNVVFIRCDVRQPEDFKAAVDLAESKFGKMTILVNNAGIGYDNSEDAGNLIAINVTGVVRGTRLAIKRMSRVNGGQGGAIVNISSLTALYDTWEPVPVYCASKSFVHLYSRCMGSPIFFNTTGVRVMCVSPGVTATPLVNRPLLLDTEYPGIVEMFRNNVNKHLLQKADNVGEGVVMVLGKGENGANYLVENNKPPLKVHMKMVEEEYLTN